MTTTLLASGVGQPHQIAQTGLIASGGGFLLIIDGYPQDKLQQYAIVNVTTQIADTGSAPILIEKWDCWLPFSYIGSGQGNTNLRFFVKFFKRDTNWAIYRFT